MRTVVGLRPKALQGAVHDEHVTDILAHVFHAHVPPQKLRSATLAINICDQSTGSASTSAYSSAKAGVHDCMLKAHVCPAWAVGTRTDTTNSKWHSHYTSAIPA